MAGRESYEPKTETIKAQVFRGFDEDFRRKYPGLCLGEIAQMTGATRGSEEG